MTGMTYARLLLMLIGLWPATGMSQPDIDWRPWSESSFALAAQAQRPVFLYLEATWCHWCHVMQAETLADPEVRAQLAQHFVSIRVDHDANPLLANRFRDWGWPALIFLAADGTELVKRAGYQSPEAFGRLLRAIQQDPTPEPTTTAATPSDTAGPSRLPDAVRKALTVAHMAHHDERRGGLRLPQKFLDRASVELDLLWALDGDAAARSRAQRTLTAGTGLIDPVWGGAYQYSTGGRWDRLHYEKLMRTQARVLRLYALACRQWRRPGDCHAAKAVQDYLLGFLRGPDGAFYVSQDADLVRGEKADGYFALDDAGRRALGIPRIDTHRYADANGQAIEALAEYHMTTGAAAALSAARTAAEWTLANRGRDDGGFDHGESRGDGRYLNDTLAMGQALLALHTATGERRWLPLAVAAADALIHDFRDPAGGFLTATAGDGPVAPVATVAENVDAALFLNRLADYSGMPRFRAAGVHALRLLTREDVRNRRFEEAAMLLVDEALRREPLHLVVVGPKDDPTAAALYAEALRTPGSLRHIEWWDATEGRLPHHDVEYPQLSRPAGFFCTAQRCSAPSFDVATYRTRIAALTALPPH